MKSGCGDHKATVKGRIAHLWHWGFSSIYGCCYNHTHINNHTQVESWKWRVPGKLVRQNHRWETFHTSLQKAWNTEMALSSCVEEIWGPFSAIMSDDVLAILAYGFSYCLRNSRQPLHCKAAQWQTDQSVHMKPNMPLKLKKPFQRKKLVSISCFISAIMRTGVILMKKNVQSVTDMFTLTACKRTFKNNKNSS